MIRPRGTHPDKHCTRANPYNLKICHCEERQLCDTPNL